MQILSARGDNLRIKFWEKSKGNDEIIDSKVLLWLLSIISLRNMFLSSKINLLRFYRVFKNCKKKFLLLTETTGEILRLHSLILKLQTVKLSQ